MGVEIGEFWRRYRTPLSAEGVFIPEEREQRDGIAHARTALGLGEADVVVGRLKVSNIVSEFATVVIMTVCRYSCPIPGGIPRVGGPPTRSRRRRAEAQSPT